MKSFNIKLVVSNSQTASAKREESVKSALEGYSASDASENAKQAAQAIRDSAAGDKPTLEVFTTLATMPHSTLKMLGCEDGQPMTDGMIKKAIKVSRAYNELIGYVELPTSAEDERRIKYLADQAEQAEQVEPTVG